VTDPDTTETQFLTAADQLMAAISSTNTRTPKRQYDDDEIVAMLMRWARVLEKRGIANPTILGPILALVQRYEEIINVIIAANAERFHVIGQHAGASQAECARALNMTTQAAGKRKAKGEAIIARRLQAAGVARLANKRPSAAEVEREKKAVKDATDFVVVALSEYLKRKAA